MKYLAQMLLGAVLLFAAVPLTAGEVVIYGGSQKVGSISQSDASPFKAIGELKGDFGGTFGVRYSAGRVVGFEQGIGFSPRFAKPGVMAFQTDSNLVIQAPGKISPYGTVGIGVFRTWGQDIPTDTELAAMSNAEKAEKVAAFAFSSRTSFAVNYGGGVKLRRLWGPLGINLDVRGYTLPGFNVKVDYNNANATVVDNSLSFIQTTAGLVINW